MRVLVIGGSVAGLFAGCLLRKAGHDVTVYERAVGDLSGRGAGLGISVELLDVMARAGASESATIPSTAIHVLRMKNRMQAVGQLRGGKIRPEAPRRPGLAQLRREELFRVAVILCLCASSEPSDR